MNEKIVEVEELTHYSEISGTGFVSLRLYFY
jgi:hypothetical protein